MNDSAEALQTLIRLDPCAARYAAEAARVRIVAGQLGLAARPEELLARLAPHAADLEPLTPGALADAVRLAALSPILLRLLAGGGGLEELPRARARLLAPNPAPLEPGPLENGERFHDLHLAAILLAVDYGQLSVADGGAWFAALADGLARAALRAAGEEEGGDEPLRLYAMGKWGGGELNIHSDLDLQLTGGGGSHALARKALDWLRHLGGAGVERLKLDLNLRPRGRDGELLIPRRALLAYVENWAEPWEIVAGLRFREIPRHPDDPVDDGRDEWLELLWRRRPQPALLKHTLLDFKARLEVHHTRSAGFSDLKLGPGGIREIEFLAQGLILMEGEAADLRLAGNSWRALRRLELTGVLNSHELQLLLTTYEKLRRLEDLLQAEELRQTHTLPGALPALERLLAAARQPGPAADSPFLAELETARQAVRDLFELKFKAEGRLLFSRGSGAGGADHFAAHFDFTGLPAGLGGALAQAWARAIAVSQGLALADLNALEMQLEAVIETLPDGAAHWHTLITALADQRRGLAPLANRLPSLNALGKIFAACPLLAGLLCRQPALLERLQFHAEQLDTLSDRLDELLNPEFSDAAAGAGAGEGTAQAVHAASAITRFSLGIAVLLEGLPGGDAAAMLARADRELLRHEWEQLGDPAVLVVALGALGGGALTPNGDWDLVFLAPGPQQARAPLPLVHQHAALTAWGKLPDLDLMLRPWGKNGEPVIAIPTLARYLESEAEPYEKLAWLRAAPVAGDPVQATELENTVLAPLRAWRPTDAELRSLWGRVGQRIGQGLKTVAGGPLSVLAGLQCARQLGMAECEAALGDLHDFHLAVRFQLELRGLKVERPELDASWEALAQSSGLPLLAEFPARRRQALEWLAPWREMMEG